VIYWGNVCRSIKSSAYLLDVPGSLYRGDETSSSDLTVVEVAKLLLEKPDLIHWSIEKCDEPRDWSARPWNAASSPKLECSS
jgi:hypothetical protein